MSIMFNEICINEEMLPKYTYIYIYIYIYMCVCVCNYFLFIYLQYFIIEMRKKGIIWSGSNATITDRIRLLYV